MSMYAFITGSGLDAAGRREVERRNNGYRTSAEVLAIEERIATVAPVVTALAEVVYDPEVDFGIGSVVDTNSDTCKINVAPGIVLQCSVDTWRDVHEGNFAV